ncbi:ATP-binding cassette domain-containing protein [Flavobacterium sp. I3-2]|uniref:ATP-binding cassette domain-containing protein n=1 Tax=Flavobacterium sp. I3-2 TaxID=2748319 RepID=UPI0015B15797|nr:ATP-binding cassette domain-containing protein [Flavobacterium sp. I3-2]
METLNVDSVLKNFNDKVILNDVAFSVEKGSILGLFGRNGSGKSTLFKCILGLEKPDFIYRKFNGKILKQSDLVKLFSYSSQEVFLPNSFTVKRLITFFDLSTNAFVLNDEMVSNNLELKIRELSYGQRFYIQLLMVIFSKKPICILDEPFSGLAPNMIEKISEYINWNKHKIFLITDHNYEDLYKIATKNVFLHNGNLTDVSNLDIENIKNRYYL